jgi:hypothetical protein
MHFNKPRRNAHRPYLTKAVGEKGEPGCRKSEAVVGYLFEKRCVAFKTDTDFLKN